MVFFLLSRKILYMIQLISFPIILNNIHYIIYIATMMLNIAG